MKDNVEIKIEKGIPLADHGNSCSRVWPFDLMEVGDSFAVPTDTKLQTFRVAMSRQHRRSEKRFMSRRKDGQLRCWRIQ